MIVIEVDVVEVVVSLVEYIVGVDSSSSSSSLVKRVNKNLCKQTNLSLKLDYIRH